MAKIKPKAKVTIADNVVFTNNKAVKHFNRYDAKIQKALIDAINKKAENPRQRVGENDKKLAVPDNGTYRLDVGKFRITYDIDGDKLLVNLITARGNTGWSEA